MALTLGTRIGPYAIDAPLGAGGMGEVYRARDTRLGRDVAVKVIAADSATDPDRLARFEQEARAAAALNHPNILAVFDIGSGSASHGPYIVSELLEGETLGARIARGRLPVRTAIELATQVARALAAAHDKGIVHRDLKPDNIFVTRDGTAKVLDFGLAKLRETAPGAGGDASTVTGRPPTAQGAVMGTVGYMAPEQVRGVDVDHRADIFAIGVTLYEMLSGQRAFRGDSGVETLNAILKSEPPEFETLGVPVPAEVARIVTHCLEKHPADRFQSARDLAFHLAGAAGSAGDAVRKAQAPEDAAAGRPRRTWALPIGLVAGALVGALVTGGALLRSRTEPTPDTTAFTISGDLSGRPAAQGMSLSPDGRTLAMTWSAADGTGQLLLRSFDEKAPRLVVGTGSPQVPFFSPDGRHVAYASATSQQLMRVPVAGGPSVAITALAGARFGGVWLPDDRIVYASSGSPDLYAVPAAGGTSEVAVPATAFDGVSLRWPTATADGQILVFTVGSQPPFRLGVFALATGRAAILGPGSSPRFAADGRLVYAFDGELWAAGFDDSRLQLATGRRLGVSVEVNSGGLATFAAVDDTIASLTAGASLRQLVIYDRAGRRQVLTEEPRRFFNNAVPSPDGTLIATSLNEASGSSVVVFDTGRNRLSPATASMSLSDVEWAPGGHCWRMNAGRPPSA